MKKFLIMTTAFVVLSCGVAVRSVDADPIVVSGFFGAESIQPGSAQVRYNLQLIADSHCWAC